MHVRRGDLVQVVQGDDAGKRGRVLRTLPEAGRVVIENVNMVYRHMRRSQEHPQGGRIRKEAPIDASSVMVVCESCNRPVRVRQERDENGRKVRVCARDGKPIPEAGTTRGKKK
jgi:large subunit ribosomal protein L24